MTTLQKNTIDKIICEGKKNPSIIGIILCGSLAKGTEKDTSDADILVVVKDAFFNEINKSKEQYWSLVPDDNNQYCEVDGKIINKDFLQKAREQGTESIISTLLYSKILYCIDSEIEELLQSLKNGISVNKENITKYYALMKSKRYTTDDDLSNILQVKNCILDTVFFACRLILAHNNRLYPCLKNMEKEIISCPDKPINFIKNMHTVLETFSLDSLDIFYKDVENYFSKYVIKEHIRKGYVIENELFWYYNVKPYEYI